MGRSKGSKTGVIGNNIDKEKFEKLCSLMCTENEICFMFNIAHDTLNNWTKITYGETAERTIKKFGEGGRVALRRMQWKHAETNPTMAIWLGKQYLGQTDRIENTTMERIQIVNDMPTDESDDLDD